MKKRLALFWKMLKRTFSEWKRSPALKDAASVAYYAIFSLPGLIIILVWITGNFFDDAVVSQELNRLIGNNMGQAAAESVQGILEQAQIDADKFYLQAFGVITLVFGASTLFFRIQKTLNDLWEVEQAPKRAFVRFLLDRISSLGIVLIIAFLLMITMLLSSLISLANTWLTIYLGIEIYQFLQISNFIITFIVTIILFAMMFRILPDVEIGWKSVWVGAILTAILFTIGKTILSLYFTEFKPTSAFGAAGSIILIMMWVNYTCVLLFFGAQFTKVYAEIKGHKIIPSKHAEWSVEKRFEMLQKEGEI